MFMICGLEDHARILPVDQVRPPVEAITAVLEAHYVNRVLPEKGLVVAIREILSVSGGFTFHSDGATHYVVQFTIIAFRPLVDEVVVGQIKESTGYGLKITLDFFDDITIPEKYLQQPAVLIEHRGLWAWQYADDEDEEAAESLVMEIGDVVRFVVKEIVFNTVPTTAQLRQQGDELLGTEKKPFVPMQVIGSMDKPGLGCVAWWLADEKLEED